MSYMSKFVGALIALLLMAIVASRQLFLFAVSRDTSGLSIPGGESHLWMAVIASVISSLAGALMFHFFTSHEKNKWSRAATILTGPQLIPIGNQLDERDLAKLAGEVNQVSFKSGEAIFHAYDQGRVKRLK